MVQLSKICPLENGGSPVLFASWSQTATMSMDKLSIASSINISRSLPWIASEIIKSVERKVWLNGGISILASSFFVPRKLAILFSLFSSANLYLPRLSGLYPKPNRSFFWITAIGHAVFFLNPFRLGFLCRALALCLNEWLLTVLAQEFLPIFLYTLHWKISKIWMNILLPSRLFPHMMLLMRWQQSCPLRQL